jgi:hypothetical protein
MTATALVVGQPIPEFEIFGAEMVARNSESGIFEVLEDGVSRSREIVWCGNLERCDFCGPLHIPRLAGALTIPVDAAVNGL